MAHTWPLLATTSRSLPASWNMNESALCLPHSTLLLAWSMSRGEKIYVLDELAVPLAVALTVAPVKLHFNWKSCTHEIAFQLERLHTLIACLGALLVPKCTCLQLSTACRTANATSGRHYIGICPFVHLNSVCPVNVAFPVNPTKPAMLQLLNSSQLQAEAQTYAASQMIQEYGQTLTVKDARLALDYYWQAAAVLGGATSVKVLSHPLLHCLHVTPEHVTARAKMLCSLCSAVLSFVTFNRQQMSACTKPLMSRGGTDPFSMASLHTAW